MVLLCTVLLSTALCLAYRRLALRFRLLDQPNARSSHSEPTPHGGGLALVLALTVGFYLSGLDLVGDQRVEWPSPYPAMLLAALLLCALGVADDIAGLSVRVRLVAYGLVCLVAAAMLGTSLTGWESVWLLLPVAAAMLWLLNLYNFMDGIDGIAAVETISVCMVAAALAYCNEASEAYVLFCLLLAAAHAGFLVLNWPPARLFMGDAGSVTTGFLVGALIVVGAVEQQLSPLCWLILLAAFIVDATWTLLWRMTTGQRFTQPHRSHAYQRLSRHFGSHAKVDFLLLAINLLWLAPLALTVVLWPQHGIILVILAYLPLLSGMAKIGRFT